MTAFAGPGPELQERWQLERDGERALPWTVQLHALYRRKAALETLVRKLEREGADAGDVAPYAKQLQDVAAKIPRNRPVVR